MENQGLPRILVFGLVGIIVLFIFGSQMFVTIQPGENAVKFYRFGGGLDKENIYGQGFKVLAPWDKMIIYETRVQEGSEKMEVLSSDGLNIIVEFSFRYAPITGSIGDLHELVGPTYLERVIKPEVRSACREVVGEYTPEELYSEKRGELASSIFNKAEKSLTKKHINLDKILISDITLPPRKQQAIQDKLIALEKVDQAKLELKRKVIQARTDSVVAVGKNEANRILIQNLKPEVLKWKGLQVTESLAKSKNSKVIIMGNGENGLPVILGRD